MKSIFLASAAMIFVGCSAANLGKPVLLSEIAAILANPSAHDGQLVRVQGAALVRFEASYICPTPETLDLPGSSKKCLSLVPGESNGSPYDIRPLDGKTVEIVGRFNARDFGHMGAYGGTIAATSGKVTGSHNMPEAPPPPPPPGSSANNSFKPTPLRGAA